MSGLFNHDYSSEQDNYPPQNNGNSNKHVVSAEAYLEVLGEVAKYKNALDTANQRIREAKSALAVLKEQLKDKLETEKQLRAEVRAYEAALRSATIVANQTPAFRTDVTIEEVVTEIIDNE